MATGSEMSANDPSAFADSSDTEFIAAFEDCSPPLEAWTHRCHIRMAWIYLNRYAFEEALATIRNGIHRFNAAKAVPDAIDRGYHETVTFAWLRIVAATMAHTPAAADSIAFCREQPHLLAKTLLRLYYTRDRIMTAEAKARFVEPDIAPLPSIH